MHRHGIDTVEPTIKGTSLDTRQIPRSHAAIRVLTTHTGFAFTSPTARHYVGDTAEVPLRTYVTQLPAVFHTRLGTYAIPSDFTTKRIGIANTGFTIATSTPRCIFCKTTEWRGHNTFAINAVFGDCAGVTIITRCPVVYSLDDTSSGKRITNRFQTPSRNFTTIDNGTRSNNTGWNRAGRRAYKGAVTRIRVVKRLAIGIGFAVEARILAGITLAGNTDVTKRTRVVVIARRSVGHRHTSGCFGTPVGSTGVVVVTYQRFAH